ncbi:MAG TPA: pitrilysin family protein [Thermoanaerobaculia bacterium]|nr:pitrilysin family protein [Thermoanaerobaculia bacterium]
MKSFAERTSRLRTDRGATILALENHFNPTLALSGTLRAGSAHSPQENPVLAALAAQMLEKGTRRRAKLVLAEELESRGISISFSASGGDPDTMDVSLSCLSRDRDVAFEALVEMLAEPAYPAEELAREKERLTGAVRQLADQTGWRSSTAASRLIYPPGHPYFAETPDDIIASIERTTDGELHAFHERFYRASTLVIAVVGDLDRDSTAADLAGRLAKLPAGEAPPLEVPPVSPPSAPAEVVRMKEKVNADVFLAHDSRLRRTDPDFLPTTLGVAALGQSTLSSRLGLRVRDTEGLTYGINARVSAGRFSGPFAISLTVAPANLARAVASARAVMDEFLAGGITEKEMADEKRSRIGKFKVDLASNAGIAGALDMAETYGFGIGYLDAFPGLVEAVTREQVNEAVRKHVRPGELVEVAAGDL